MAYYAVYIILLLQKRSFNYTKLYKIRDVKDIIMAQGVYHIFNAAKMRLLEATYKEYPNAISTNQIAKRTGMEKGKVSRLMSHYHNHNYRYFRRLKKRDDDSSYRYKINKKGVKVMTSFILRIKQGCDLNLRKKTPVIVTPRVTRRKPQIKSDKDLKLSPEELAPYVRLSYRGEHELDVKNEDKLRLVGIIKDKPVKAIDKEPEVPENPVKEPLQQMIPSKIYTTKQGNTLSSEEMAKTIV